MPSMYYLETEQMGQNLSKIAIQHIGKLFQKSKCYMYVDTKKQDLVSPVIF